MTCSNMRKSLLYVFVLCGLSLATRAAAVQTVTLAVGMRHLPLLEYVAPCMQAEASPCELVLHDADATPDMRKLESIRQSEAQRRQTLMADVAVQADALMQYVVYGSSSEYLRWVPMQEIRSLTAAKVLAEFQEAFRLSALSLPCPEQVKQTYRHSAIYAQRGAVKDGKTHVWLYFPERGDVVDKGVIETKQVKRQVRQFLRAARAERKESIVTIIAGDTHNVYLYGLRRYGKTHRVSAKHLFQIDK